MGGNNKAGSGGEATSVIVSCIGSVIFRLLLWIPFVLLVCCSELL